MMWRSLDFAARHNLLETASAKPKLMRKPGRCGAVDLSLRVIAFQKHNGVVKYSAITDFLVIKRRGIGRKMQTETARCSFENQARANDGRDQGWVKVQTC